MQLRTEFCHQTAIYKYKSSYENVNIYIDVIALIIEGENRRFIGLTGAGIFTGSSKFGLHSKCVCQITQKKKKRVG